MNKDSFQLVDLERKSRSPLRIGPTPIGSGADANIYQIANQPNLVAKIYHDPDRDSKRSEKIRAMLATPPDLPPIQENGTSYIQIAWPTALIENSQGRFTGYAMPFVNLKQATELGNLLSGKTRKVLGIPEFYGYRVVSAANLASLVAALHARGHYIIDLKPANLSVYLSTFYLALLDCDGLSIRQNDGQYFSAHQYTDGYIAPEALQRRLHPQDLGENQDRFALAVIIFQLLNQGIHPYQGVPLKGSHLPTTDSGRIQQNLYAYNRKGHQLLSPSPWSIHEFLEDETRELFDRAFGPNPDLRPTAEAWECHLQYLAAPKHGVLKRCSRNPNHGMFSKGCGFCHLKDINRCKNKTIFPKSVRTKAKPFAPRKRVIPQTAPVPKATQRLKIAVKTPRWVKAMAICILAILFIILFWPPADIHTVIKKNKKHVFIKRSESNQIVWQDLKTDDLYNAASHEDQQILCLILSHINNIQFDNNFFKNLIADKRFKAIPLYLATCNNLPRDFSFVSKILDAKYDEVQKSYFMRLKELNMSDEVFENVFRYGDADDYKKILDFGADPNIWVKVQDADVLKALFERPSPFRIHIGYPIRDNDSRLIKEILSRYNRPITIPGVARVTSMMTLQAALSKNPDGHDGYRDLDYSMQPLTMAMIRGELEKVRTLLEAGAAVGYSTINFSFGGKSDVYAFFRNFFWTHYGPDKDTEINQIMLDDDPAALEVELDSNMGEKLSLDTTGLLTMAKNMASLRIVDALIDRYNISFDPDNQDILLYPFKANNPILMAYFLKRGARYDNIFQFSIIQEYGTLANNLGEMLYQDELLQKKIFKTQAGYKIGDLLYEYSKKTNCWGMAFVLDDVASNWSDFHLAVLSENIEKINAMLETDPDLLNGSDAKGRTPLALTAWYQCNESFKTLLAFDPDLNSEDDDGYTPLMRAAAYGNAEMVEKLIANGAKLTNSSHPDCAIALQISSAIKETADNLRLSFIDHGIDLNEAPFLNSTEEILKSYDMIEGASITAELHFCSDETFVDIHRAYR